MNVDGDQWSRNDHENCLQHYANPISKHHDGRMYVKARPSDYDQTSADSAKDYEDRLFFPFDYYKLVTPLSTMSIQCSGATPRTNFCTSTQI
jgi:hypothetical protein